MTNTREAAQQWGKAGIEMIAAMNAAPIVAILIGISIAGGNLPSTLGAPVMFYGTGAALAVLAMLMAFGSLRFLDRAETFGDTHARQVEDFHTSNRLMYAAAACTAGAIAAFAIGTFALAAAIAA